MVSLLSHNEEEFVVQLAANNTAFWIGLNDDEGPETGHTEGVFKWTSGEEYSEMKYQKWKTGEPNNRKHLDCVKADATGWAMATGGCAASKLPYVCKKKGKGINELNTLASVVFFHVQQPISMQQHYQVAVAMFQAIIIFFVALRPFSCANLSNDVC